MSDNTNAFAPAAYDTEINTSLSSNTLDSQSSIVGTITGGAVATVVDIGASLWNSLPGTPEVETEDILGRWSGNALKVYEEHPDAIKTASLIGGAIMPGAVAMKGMTAMRNGSKAVNWFTKLGREADMAKAAELFSAGGKATTEYKKLTRGIFAKGLLNQALDAAAAEVAVATLYNAHPYMEDYFEDPVKNFGIGVLFGGVVGGGIGAIGDRFALKQLTGGIEAGVFNDVIKPAIRPALPTMPDATALQTMDLSIKNLDNIMRGRKDLGFSELDDLTYGQAAKYRSDLQARQSELWNSMLEGDLKSLSVEEKNSLMATVIDGSGFWGVEKIRQVDAKELLDAPNGRMSNFLADAPTLKKTDKRGIESGKSAIYYPEEGRFGTKDDLGHHAGLAALGHTEESLLKLAPAKNARVPNYDSSLEMLAKSTAAAEADFAAWTLRLGKMDDDEFGKFLEKSLLSHSDAPLMQAVITRLEASPTLLTRAKVKIADTTPHSQAILEEANITRTAGGTPVKYQQAAEQLLNNKTVKAKYSLEGTSDELGEYVLDWIKGDTWDMIKGATAYFSKGWAAKSIMRAKDSEAVKASAKRFSELYNHPKSAMLRKDLMSLADKDGKIYLYRGVNAPKVFGSAPLESMAITPSKAGQFGKGANGKTLLYKVDVDDVVSAHVDVGNAGDNVELIVRASAREAEATLTPNGRIAFRQQLESSLKQVNTAKEATYGDLREMLTESKFSMVTGMIRRGYPPEVVSKRANLALDPLRQFMASDLSLDAFESSVANAHKFKSVDDVTAANSLMNRPIEVRGNLQKTDYTKAHSRLSAKNLNDINDSVVSTALAASSSVAARSVGTLIYDKYKQALDIVKSQLGYVNGELAGSRYANSFDFYTRNMKDVGITLSGLSKDFQANRNHTIQRVLTPVTEAMSTVARDTVALAEFGIFKNLNDSLSGYRIFKDGQLMQKVERAVPDGKPVTVLEPVLYQGKEYKVVTPSVIKLIESMQQQSRELLAIQEAGRRITGAQAINDIGLWMPSHNPADKAVAYVHYKNTDTTELLYARNETELEDVIKTFTSEAKGNPNMQIVRKSDQKTWSMLNGRTDPVGMRVANTAMRKEGSGASAIPALGRQVLSDVAGGYEHAINAYMRNLEDVSLSDITDTLRKMSSANKRLTADQPFGEVKKILRAPKDPAESILNTLLNQGNLGEYAGWKSLNKSFETGLAMASDAFTSVWDSATAPLKKAFFGASKQLTPEAAARIDYEQFTQDLAARGVPNPFADYDIATAVEKFGVATLDQVPDVSKRIVYGSNALAATMALRFGDLAQPLVNMMSWPILTGMAVSMSKNASFLGVARAEAQVSGNQVMADGVRAMMSPLYEHWGKAWEKAGYFTPLVSEASDIMRATRKFDKGAWAATERALDSKLVQMASVPADYSEALVRKTTMYTGAMLAKRLYPGLDDNGITIFARDFMDKSLGNYTASQRPVVFQGSLGVALGLFQTYFLTLAQNTYRHLELKDFKGLGKAALAQSTVFGASSLPGFDVVSKTIGENFSDENVDLTTGIYRATGDTTADMILYGLPSNLGPSFYTRGGIDPRLPNVLGGLQNTVAMNFAMQTTQMFGELSRAMSQDNESAGRAVLQALSLQNMSRPIARMSELASGYSITRAGNTVSTPEEVWTTTSAIARVLSTRPLEEAKLRQADHLNRYYEAANRDKRQQVMNELRTDIRASVLDESKVSAYAEKYFRFGGSPAGWRAAYKEATGRTETSGKEVLLDKLKDGNPLMYMIDGLDGEY